MESKKESNTSQEAVEDAKALFVETIQKIQSVSRDFSAKTSHSLDLISKLQFSEEELRTLVRLVSTLSDLISIHDIYTKDIIHRRWIIL